MANEAIDTGILLDRAADGDHTAVQSLLDRHRHRLKRMVALRMDPRLKARLDPSDVVQEALMRASDRLPAYLRDRRVPFYPWLRNIAWEQLAKLNERHVAAKKRSVAREDRPLPPLPDESVSELVDRLAASAPGPRTWLLRDEIRRRTRQSLQSLPARDREILELRYLEQLENDEIAAILGISPGAVRTRHFRAIRRLQAALGDLNH
jgi:RNA polymerase sigma-70 factor (ECF subfamily)